MKKIVFLLILYAPSSLKIETKSVSVPNHPSAYCLASTVDRSTDFAAISSIHNLLKELPALRYIKCHNRMQLEFTMFPLASSPDSSWADPYIPETFILILPQGRVYSSYGVVLINDHLIKELIWQWSPLKKGSMLNLTALPKVKHITGKVAVITQEGCENYYHWVTEVLPKLAMLESKKIEYDWLYVPTKLPFMPQTLALLGIDAKKIIEAQDATYIEADELIVPSAPSLSTYTPTWIVEYIQSKLIPIAVEKVPEPNFSNKVFISRKKASYRRIINEDDLFKIFEEKGFVRYNLEDLSLPEQIVLFKNADIIVAAHGAGLLNLLFAKPGTHVIEIFQEHEDDTYWYLSQTLGLQHTCIKTTDFKRNGGYTDTIVPLELIRPVVNA